MLRTPRRLIVSCVSLIALVSLLAACAPAPPAAPPTAVPQPTAAASAASPVQARLDEVGRRAGQERQQFLEEQAKKEGKVVVYSSADPDLIKDWNTLFSQKYPQIDAQFVRMTTEAVLQRSVAESQAGRPVADILAVTEEVIAIVQSRGMLARYSSPEGRDFDQKYRDANGLHTTVYFQPKVLGVNTQKAKKSDVPRTLEGLADPTLKGKLGRPGVGSRWVGQVIQVKGEAAGMDILRKIAALEPRLYDSNTAVGNALASGQIAMAFDIYVNNVDKLKKDGAPVEYVVPDEVFVAAQPIAIPVDAPHPYAAALAYDWLLSKEGGQSLYVKHGRLGPRKDTEYAFADIIKEAKTVVTTSAAILADDAKYQKIYEDLFVRK